VLVMPFTPNGKENMVSYLAATSDPDDYGEMTLFSLDRARTIFGPTQVNARILADPTVASELTLLSQRGSRAILGNLLTVPIKDSLLYVQPIFVQGSAANSIPLLQRVAVFYNNTVGYSPSLAESLGKVIGGTQAQPPADGRPTPPPSSTTNVQELLRQADAEYKAAQRDLAAGKLAGYQEHIDRMADLVQQALARGDGASATTTPPTTTAPPG
jgi:uncharacterized membrane protein (UPF0182 family)